MVCYEILEFRPTVSTKSRGNQSEVSLTSCELLCGSVAPQRNALIISTSNVVPGPVSSSAEPWHPSRMRSPSQHRSTPPRGCGTTAECVHPTKDWILVLEDVFTCGVNVCSCCLDDAIHHICFANDKCVLGMLNHYFVM